MTTSEQRRAGFLTIVLEGKVGCLTLAAATLAFCV